MSEQPKREMRSQDHRMKEFYANITFAQAREHLRSYTIEEVRQLLEEGAFGEVMTQDLKKYLHQRITDPDFV